MNGTQFPGRYVRSWLTSGFLLCKTCCLTAIIIPCLSAFCFGAWVLFSVMAVRQLSVAWAHASFPLHLDYRGEAAIGTASFTSMARPANPNLLGDVSRVVERGEKLDIALELVVPGKVGDYELFHVAGELLSTNDTVLATSAISFLNSQKTTLFSLLRKALLLPLTVFEWWWSSPQTINLEIFAQYVESESFPAIGLKVTLEARHLGALPKVSDAKVHLGRNLGIVRQALFMIRPSGVPTLILLLIGFSFVIAGGMGCCLLILVLLMNAGNGNPDGSANTPIGNSPGQHLADSAFQFEDVGDAISSTGQASDTPQVEQGDRAGLRKRRA